MRSALFSLSVILLILSVAISASAETRYISDQLVVTVRSNKTNKYEVLESLITASPVEILAEDANFVKVRTQKGVEGFIRKQYVSRALPKSVQLAELKKQKAALEEQLRKQQQEFQNATGQASSSETIIKQLNEELDKSNRQLVELKSKYDALEKLSQDSVDLLTERDELLEENGQILNELKVLQEENKDFHRSNMIQWFLAGGGVFLVGWLAGKISRKKRGYSRF